MTKQDDVIARIRERREAFAAKFDFDPKRIAEAAMALVDRTRFNFGTPNKAR